MLRCGQYTNGQAGDVFGVEGGDGQHTASCCGYNWQGKEREEEGTGLGRSRGGRQEIGKDGRCVGVWDECGWGRRLKGGQNVDEMRR